MADTRVLIVDDETVIRQALAQLLRMEPEIEVVGTGANGQEAVQLAAVHRPDVVLIDLNMPVMDGLAAIRCIKQQQPGIEICVLTVFDDEDHLFEALKAGAQGYLLKDATPRQVAHAVRAVARGEAILAPGLAARVIEEFRRLAEQKEEIQRLFGELSHREVEILQLLAEGRSNRSIAGELYLSEKTVKNHVSNILRKLEVNSRTEAAVLAVESGLARRPPSG